VIYLDVGKIEKMRVRGSKEYGGTKDRMVKEKMGRKEKEKNVRKGKSCEKRKNWASS